MLQAKFMRFYPEITIGFDNKLDILLEKTCLLMFCVFFLIKFYIKLCRNGEK